MKLSELLGSIREYELFGRNDQEISSIADDSRKIGKQGLFLAIRGLNYNGYNFIPDVIKKGVTVVVGEETPNSDWFGKEVTYVKVNNSREALSHLASKWYGDPALKLKIIGITGTKGKTTTAFILHQILASAGKKVGLVSSITTKIGVEDYETGLHVTNPEPLKLQKFLSEMVKKGCEYAVLEVTSHGLDQERVAGINFEIGILTNIAHEHLDYHKTLDNYQKTKLKLFKSSKISVLNKDDISFGFMSRSLGDSERIVTYAIDHEADYTAKGVYEDETTDFKIKEDEKTFNLQTELRGKFNVSNIVAAVAAARKLGVGWKNIQKAIGSLPHIPGRLEEVKNDCGFKIYIDFAHTPDSLEKVLSYLGKKTKGKLISVFGCAGERDVKKRPMMGGISGKLADVSIFTAEDPRSENVNKIISQIASGAKESGAIEMKLDPSHLDQSTRLQAPGARLPKTGTVGQALATGGQVHESTKHTFYRIPERGEAIAFAIQKIAKKGDLVVVAGKGHEKSMAYEGVEHPWSDKEIVKDCLAAVSNKGAIVFAAGLGTRMKSTLPKVLHKVVGLPMISYTLSNLRKAKFGEIIVVVGHKKLLVMKEVGLGVIFAHQRKRLGTGDALLSGLQKLEKGIKDVVVLNGDDSAFYNPETLSNILNNHKESGAVMTFATLILDNSFGLGRVLRIENGLPLKIVEEKEASEEEKKIKEVNIGLYVFNRVWAERNIKKIEKSPGGEYYIVDLVKIALDQGEKVNLYNLGSQNEWIGVNTLEQLKEADIKMREKIQKLYAAK